MTKARIIHGLAVVMSIAAAIICLELLNKHVGGSAAAKWFDAGCSDSAAPGSANCAAVLASPYSYFPARAPDGGGRGGLPVAFLGLTYYTMLALWLVGVGRPSSTRRWLHAVPLLVVGFGLAMSGYYVNVMLRVLDQWCPWCAVTHVLNLGIALCVVLMWPRRRKTGDAACAVAPFPSGRVVFLTSLCIASMLFAEVNLLGLKNYKRQFTATQEQLVAAVNRLKGDPIGQVRNWQNGPKREVVIREDEPVRVGPSNGLPPLDIVVFSDFECPSCGRFALALESSIAPLFAGNVRTLFKHYPIDQSCNARSAVTMHPHACQGATMAEAARLMAGNEGFWRAHDYLFKNRDALAAGTMTPNVVATAMGLDPTVFSQAMNDPRIKSRINDDIEQAKLIELRGTPTILVQSRAVDTVAAGEIAFWDKLADVYWKSINTPRPESTRMKPVPTPSTPGPTTAP